MLTSRPRATGRGRGRRSRCRRPSRRRRRSRRSSGPGSRPAARAARASGPVDRARASRASAATRSRCAAMPGLGRLVGRRGARSTSVVAERAARAAASSSRAWSRWLSSAEAHARGRTRRCPRRASWTRPGRGRRGWPCTASSAGCRRRSTSSRWRWRSAARSPKSCVSSLRYGVSPQPAQAPEYSNSGWRNCEPLTSMRAMRRAVGLGQVEEEVVVLPLRLAQRRAAAPC